MVLAGRGRMIACSKGFRGSNCSNRQEEKCPTKIFESNTPFCVILNGWNHWNLWNIWNGYYCKA
jgi:hypothetical protein